MTTDDIKVEKTNKNYGYQFGKEFFKYGEMYKITFPDGSIKFSGYSMGVSADDIKGLELTKYNNLHK